MLHGHIDLLRSPGYIEGWAHESDDAVHPIVLSVSAKGQVVAQGVANLYRVDLMEAGIGTGWCGFKLHASVGCDHLTGTPLSLRAMPGDKEIFQATFANVEIDDSSAPQTIEEIVKSDPTTLRSIEQLRGCAFVFSKSIESGGIKAFVRAAYIYVLGRPADREGLLLYSHMIRNGDISPFGLLEVLSDSDEFRSRPHSLIAPTQPEFIFNAL